MKKPNPLSVMQPGEQVVCEIKRHPFGLFSMYISVGLGLLVLLVAAVLGPHYIPDASAGLRAAFLLGFVVIAAISLLFVYISTYVYQNNRWILTNDSITQVTQIGLFRKQSSQLSLANMEDVTAEKSGMMQAMLNFGGLRVETAGERSKFFFSFCPNPDFYARQILAAREAFIRNDPAMAKRANDKLTTPDYAAEPNNPVEPAQPRA